MNTNEFEKYLHTQIPITHAMQFKVEAFDKTQVSIQAKLAPNINHKSTAFGGSINSLMTVCGWAMMYCLIKPVDTGAHIVIQKSSIQYYQPIHQDFTATCQLEENGIKEKFIQTYQRYNKARLSLKVECKDTCTSASFEGHYVAFK